MKLFIEGGMAKWKGNQKFSLTSLQQKLEQNQGVFCFVVFQHPDIRDLFSEVGLN